MSDRLFIDGVECDLNPDTVIAITYQINDVGTLEDRQSNYTNQFKIPRTFHNRSLFQQLDVPHVQTFMPYRKLAAKVIKDGVEVIADGYAIVESAGAEYAVTVYGGLIDFFKLLEGRTLQDLDLNSYNHLWNLSTMANSVMNNSGYIYGLIDNGSGYDCISPTANTINADHVAPCFFIHTIVSAIVAQAGYTMYGEPLNDSFYKQTLIQLGCDGLTTQGLVLRATRTSDYNSHTTQGGVTMFVEPNDDSSGSSTTQVGNFDTLSAYNNTNGLWTMPQDANAPDEFQMKWEFDVEFIFHSGLPTWLTAAIEVNGTRIYRKRIGRAVSNQTLTASVYMELPNGDYNLNDQIRCVVFTEFPDPNTLQWSVTIKQGATVQAVFNQSVQLTFGGAVNVSHNLPQWTQTDFMKAVSQVFGLMWKPDYATRTLYVGSMKVIESRLLTAVDWSNKLHNVEDANGNTVVDMKFRLGNYAQKNIFAYDNDDSVTNNLGSGSLSINNETLEQEAEVIRLPFSGSDTVVTTQSQVLFTKVPMWESPQAGATTYGTITVKPRLLYLDRQTQFATAFSWVYGNNQVPINSVWNFLWFINPANQQNLGYNNSLLRDYYNSYARIFNRVQVITAQFKLTTIDIQNLDHFTPVYIAQFGNYYYVNKVMNYVGGNKLTKVELVKIGEEAEVIVQEVYPEMIRNGLFDQGISDTGNVGLKHWDTPYRAWANTSPTTQQQNGCYFDYQNNNPIALEQTFVTALDNGGTYQIKFTINEFTQGAFDLNIKDGNGTTQYQIPAGTVSGIPSGIEYVDTFGVNAADWVMISIMPDASFDGGIYNISLKRIA